MIVPYKVQSGVSGMGVFLKAPVKKGKKIWLYRSQDHLMITESDVPELRRALSSAAPEVALWFTRWTYPYDNDNMVFEFDDGRFFNDASDVEPNVESLGMDIVATHDLQAGTELLESYSEDLSDDPEWWTQLLTTAFDDDNSDETA